MRTWLALSLGVLLGQTPEITQPSTSDAAHSGKPSQEVQQLRAQIQSLQAQLQAQQQQNAASAQLLQQQLTDMQQRGAALEQMRQQRVADLERARNWMVEADNALSVGELAIGTAISEADSALAGVIQSASAAGNGQTVVLLEEARDLLSQVIEATGRRDTAEARRQLFDADWRVRSARNQNLDAPSGSIVTQ